ncbi:receptor tyrosine-protein kinase erbB-3-like isoform X2 [Mya arenaria]|uniref:receptor tyrosine-protein kinase erbB-3-like isoform X2 n=1 Tax=Mya arenaria TaxID=6604 RepID=UPI0022E9705D|nr:receptor tyrosine-protein kinase erbB-3-like isoform X2 [Mya arenaria]
MGTIGKFKWNFTILLFTIVLCASQCPDHKPFASETGCVSGCPELFYIRNTTCVFDCGNDFGDETNHCVPSCPDGYLYRETLKTSGKGMFIEKMCIVYCYYDEVISNTECIKRCPPSQMYLDIEDYHQRCISICPARKPFLINITFQERDQICAKSKC